MAQNFPPPVHPAAPAAAAPLMTRVALINLGVVIKNYKKFKDFQTEINTESQKLQKEFDQVKANATAKQAEAARPDTPPARRELLEKEMRDLQRRIQDMGEDAKNKIGKMEFDMLVKSYKEIKEMTATVARSRNFDLVLHYNDGVDADAYLPAIFQRKLANGACFPMYSAPGMDITNDVVSFLNQRVASGSPVSDAH